MHRIFKRFVPAIAIAGLAALLTGCVVVPGYGGGGGYYAPFGHHHRHHGY